MGMFLNSVEPLAGKSLRLYAVFSMPFVAEEEKRSFCFF